MSKVDRQRDKYSNSKELRGNSSNEGTAARTRPFSYEEIMLRRKNKKQAEDTKEGGGELRRLPEKDNSESALDHSGPEKAYKSKKDSILGVVKDFPRDSEKDILRKKGGDKSKKDVGSLKDKGIVDSEARLKVKSRKDKGKSSKDKGERNEEQTHHKSRNGDRSRYNFESDSDKKRSKDMAVKDVNKEKNRSSHREAKRKHLGRADEERMLEMDAIASKRHDSGKWQDAEYLERKSRRKESSQSHYEETRAKRRRSKSWERSRDRDRRSVSTSPRPGKRMSYRGQDRGESPSRSLKDRLGRQHSSVDKNRKPSNGGHSSGHYRRHGGHTSGLGGYSPRKRRTEAAVRTPSPTKRSPERKTAAWDMTPDDIGASSMTTNSRSSHQAVSSSKHELANAATATLATEKSQAAASTIATSTVNDISVDTIQLTQATRPTRRLYVENVPPTASDKAIMDCLNDFLLLSGVNHVQGTQPCISCIINKERGQAVVEFLTPEDATSALSFDGRSFAGSILKIRRPKEFIGSTVGVTEKPLSAFIPISDVVEDTPQKIFIGGISKILSADMLKEIVGAFGSLKAYRFEVNKELNEPLAFLEYVDQSVTLKACAGLNGMKLGGSILTVVQAVPDAAVERTAERSPFYGIPEHAKPLLEEPTQVLKLKNLFNQEEFSMLSELDLEEILEDIRLECTRFGTVKSVNIIRYDNECDAAPDALEAPNNGNGQSGLQDPDSDPVKAPSVEEKLNAETEKNGEVEPQNDVEEPHEVNEIKEINKVSDDKPMHDVENGECGSTEEVDIKVASEEALEVDTTEDQSACSNEDAGIQVGEPGSGNDSVPEEPKQEEADGDPQKDYREVDTGTVEEPDVENGDSTRKACNLDAFEKGCILIEYVRREAACAAAHCLHGRQYGERIVGVEYVPNDLYRMRFPK